MESRYKALKQAICRYVAADEEVPMEWIAEYNDLCNIICGKRPDFKELIKKK